jgi:hypothetical protein
MLDYDFAKLNDKEFEAFGIDLLSQYLQQRIERFKAGKDAGVDGRYFSSRNEEVVVQCKQWSGTGIDALVRQLKSVEAPKLDILRPKRYLLVTSLPLSRKNKTDIQSALLPWIKLQSDIFGREDLNYILGKFPEVEERHYKLWFTSVNIMLRLHNASIKGRSEFKISEAEIFAPKYVITSAHSEAVKKLETIKTIIITGEPGIGKSTLAEQVALQYLLKGFEICCIANSPDEAEAVWQNNTRQLFYFDDFLGRNYFVALEHHQDSHIVGLIKRIRNDASKRFILTSRTTVLNRGKSLSDLFRIENLNRNEYELKVDALTLLDKARILYNHLWYSDLDKSYVQELYTKARYLSIAQHRNYNPRLIAFITDSYKVQGISPENYWQYIQSTVQNPTDIWAHVFDNQLNASVRLLVRLIVFNGRDISEEEIQGAYSAYAHLDAIKTTPVDDFEVAVRLATGSVLNRIVSELTNSVSFSVFNPSLGDFVIHRYKKDPIEVAACLTALQTHASLRNLLALGLSKKLGQQIYKTVLSILARRSLNDEYVSLSYRVELGGLLARVEAGKYVSSSPEFIHFNEYLFANSEHSNNCGTQAQILCVGVGSSILPDDDERWFTKLRSLIDASKSQEELESISELMSKLQSYISEELSELFVLRYVDVWRRDIDTAVNENGVLDEFTRSTQIPKARKKIMDFIRGEAGQISVDIPTDALAKIVSACDVSAIIQGNQQRDREDTEGPPTAGGSYRDSAGQEIAEVHDLFDPSK